MMLSGIWKNSEPILRNGVETRVVKGLGKKIKRLIDREVMRIEMMFGEFRVRATVRNDYQFWKRSFSFGLPRLASLESNANAKPENIPVFSIAIVDEGGSRHLLAAVFRSILSQNYPHLELIVISVRPDDVLCDTSIERLIGSGQSCKAMRLDAGKSKASQFNDALRIARGEWVIFLDIQSRLSDGGLYAIVAAINQSIDVWMCYGDEDCVDVRGRFLAPYFKPDWGFSYFSSVNMLGKAVAFDRKKIMELGGFSSAYSGSEEFDLVLRGVERWGNRSIAHSPRVICCNYIDRQHGLEFWRERLKYDVSAVAALQSFFRRTNIDATVGRDKHGLRISYELSANKPRVSLIIPTRNSGRLVKQCIDSIIQRTDYPNYEIILIDNGSDEIKSLEIFSQLSKESQIRIIRDDRPFNFSALNNVAVSNASGEVIALVNNDVEVISTEWLAEMVSLAVQPQVGAVGAKLLYPDGRVQHAGIILGIKGVAGHSNKGIDRQDTGYFCRAAVVGEFSAVTAACLVVRKSLYERVGGLNENELAVSYNDVDFCLKLVDIGFQNVWTPFAELYHHESASRGYEITPEKKIRLAQEASYMRERWNGVLKNDPFYNPNLTLKREDFSLSWPPRR